MSPDPSVPCPTALWFVIAHIAMAVVFVALLKVELLQRTTERRLSELRMALEEAAS